MVLRQKGKEHQMAYVNSAQPIGSSIAGLAGKFADAVTRFFVVASRARDRTEVVRVLQSKTDAELALMGIERDRIVHHVYRDLINL